MSKSDLEIEFIKAFGKEVIEKLGNNSKLTLSNLIRFVDTLLKRSRDLAKKENRKLLNTAKSALISYQYGNSSPDLAEEVVEAINKYLEEHVKNS